MVSTCTAPSVVAVRRRARRRPPRRGRSGGRRGRGRRARPTSAGALVGRKRDEQPAGGLRVLAERDELVGDAVRGHVRVGEVAVAAVAARLLARAGDLERAVERGPARPTSRTSCTPLRSAISCAWPSSPKPVTSVTAFGRNARSTSAQSRFRVFIHSTAAATSSSPARPRWAPWSTSPVPSGFVRKQRVARLRAGLRPDAVGVDGADDGEPVLRLLVADRVPAGEDRAGLAHLPVGGAEDRGDRLLRQLLRELGDREREQRPAAHREDVVQRVGRGDRPEVVRVVDERREEVEREDERGLVVEAVDGRVVGRARARRADPPPRRGRSRRGAPATARPGTWPRSRPT